MFGGKTNQASGVFTMVSTSEHAALAVEPAHQQRAEAAGLRPDPSRVWPQGGPAGLW